MDTVQSADGTIIAFEREGQGPAVILVVGAFCDRDAPRALGAQLAADFTVYRYDRRGRGDSGDTQPYAVEREIEDLASVITAAGGTAAVFGHSSGAVLALEAAAHGLPITRLAVYEPPYVVDGTRPAAPVDLAPRLASLVAEDRRDDAADLFLTEAVGVPAEVIAMIRRGPDWPSMTALAHTLAYDVTICEGQVLPAERLATISVPTLALAGGASPDWARNSVRVLASVIPDAKHLELAGQDHGVADEVIAPLLAEYFA